MNKKLKGQTRWSFRGPVLMVALVSLMLTPVAVRADDGHYLSKFYGFVQSLPPSGLVGDWVVSGRVIHVSPWTRIEQEHGLVAVGSLVEVKGQPRADGSYDAYEIEVKHSPWQPPMGSRLVGFVESLPPSGLVGDWVVSGRVIHVSPWTRIEQEHGLVAVGSLVEVKGQPRADGSYDAYEIEVKQSPWQPPMGSRLVGFVESLPPSGLVGDWVVSGRVIHVSPWTRIEQEHGLVAIGSLVEVKGQPRADGSYDAYEIEVKQSAWQPPMGSHLVGVVEALPAEGLIGDWRVAGVVVHVSQHTRIKQEHGLVAVGSLVEVKGQPRADGSYDAYEIEVKQSAWQPPMGSHLVGVVEALPAEGLIGDWRVAGVVVHVSQNTRIEQEHGLVAVGSLVKVEGAYQRNGSFDAFKVEVLANHGGSHPGSSEKRFGVLKLQPTAAAPADAEAVALVRSFAVGGVVVQEDLKVAVEHLLPTQTYDVFVDSIYAGAILTDAEAKGHLFLSSANIPGAEPLPAELSPVTARQRIEVRQGDAVILEGDFANARWDGDGHHASPYLAAAPLATPETTIVGMAVTKIDDGQQELKLMAFSLPTLASIDVVVDGIFLGTVTTSPTGFLHGKFSTAPEEDELPLPTEALPVSAWQQIQLKASDGTVLASGSFVSGLGMGPATAPGQIRPRKSPKKR